MDVDLVFGLVASVVVAVLVVVGLGDAAYGSGGNICGFDRVVFWAMSFIFSCGFTWGLLRVSGLLFVAVYMVFGIVTLNPPRTNVTLTQSLGSYIPLAVMNTCVLIRGDLFQRLQ